jgi:hypothetical protein
MSIGLSVLSISFQATIRLSRWILDPSVLIMNSIFLGMMNSHDLHVNRGIVIAEGFAVVGVMWNFISLCFTACSGIWFISLLVIPAEAFIMGCYIFIAMVYKQALGDCKGYVDTPFGDVSGVYGLPSVRDSCGMQVANFSISTVAA